MANNTKVGDVFEVKIDAENKKYLQYISSDLTQLNSDVIRTFKALYFIDDNPNLLDVVRGEIDFYAHCVTKWGVKLGFWENVGNVSEVGNLDDILFRDSGDYGNPQIKISHDWWVWKMNENQEHVGKLKGENRDAEIGIIIPPESIVYRMKTGMHDFSYPGYE